MTKTTNSIGKRFAVAVMATVFVALAGIAQAQTKVYVSAAAANDNGNGQSWETAKKTIAAGISAAGSNGTVFVKAGDYGTTAEFTVPAGVTVMGGYRLESTGTDTSLRRLPGTNVHWTDPTYCTIISGAGTHRIATVNGTLEGCVVRNGFTTTNGGGVLINGGTVRYCVIKECVATEAVDATAEGGGAYVSNNGTLINCVITACRADNGAAVSGESGSLINNTITRNGSLECSSVTDYDGNVYHAVQIGTQCWMAENLRTTHYADGSGVNWTITYSLDKTIYGLYYNWSTVMHGAESHNSIPSGVQGICPTGWHVPSMTEWAVLTGYLSVRSQYICGSNSNNIAKSLASIAGWNSSNNTCCIAYQPQNNNITGFNAYPAGYLNSALSLYNAHQSAWFWSCTSSSDSEANYLYLSYGSSTVGTSNNPKTYRMSVRCLKD